LKVTFVVVEQLQTCYFNPDSTFLQKPVKAGEKALFCAKPSIPIPIAAVVDAIAISLILLLFFA
jgi:hypothetical protein